LLHLRNVVFSFLQFTSEKLSASIWIGLSFFLYQRLLHIADDTFFFSDYLLKYFFLLLQTIASITLAGCFLRLPAFCVDILLLFEGLFLFLKTININFSLSELILKLRDLVYVFNQQVL